MSHDALYDLVNPEAGSVATCVEISIDAAGLARKGAGGIV
jgi:hypothetical protein